MGFGAIMPGVSGGALCAAFGMYKPIVEVMAHPVKAFRKYIMDLLPFALGGIVGFWGLSGLAGYLLERNSEIAVCVFAGLILGTFPGLLKDAAEEGRNTSSYVSMIVGFAVMFILLLIFKRGRGNGLEPGIWSYLLCGVLWGLSFIVPGLSSSTLLMFFGIYQPMLAGIAALTPGVVIPLGAGAVATVLVSARLISMAFARFHNILSHLIIGIVGATTVMILPDWRTEKYGMAVYILCILGGMVISYIITKFCDRLKESAE